MKHPLQFVTEDEHGVRRFTENKIVSWLLDNGPFDMNDIAMGDFSREDREQFAQLIGYSVSGASGLSYMSADVIDMAYGAETGLTEIQILKQKLNDIRESLREPISELYCIHPDDLNQV